MSDVISHGYKFNKRLATLIEICKEINIPFVDHSWHINPNKHLNTNKLHFDVAGYKTDVDNL